MQETVDFKIGWFKPLVAAVALLLLLGAFGLSTTSVDAQQGPPGLDNFCDAQGPWGDGRCTRGTFQQIRWHFECGWFMARFDDGRLKREDVPRMCHSVLPPPPPPRPLPPELDRPRLCLADLLNPGTTLCLVGVNDLWRLNDQGAPIFRSLAIQAPDPAAALLLCQRAVSSFTSVNAQLLHEFNPGFPANRYICEPSLQITPIFSTAP